MIKEDILWLDLMEILNYQIQGFFATMVLYFWAASDSHCGLCIITYNGPFRPMPMCTFFFRLGILSSLFFFFLNYFAFTFWFFSEKLLPTYSNKMSLLLALIVAVLPLLLLFLVVVCSCYSVWCCCIFCRCIRVSQGVDVFWWFFVFVMLLLLQLLFFLVFILVFFLCSRAGQETCVQMFLVVTLDS